MDESIHKRDSRAFEPDLISDPVEKAKIESSNGFRQYDYGIEIIQQALEREKEDIQFKLRPSIILALHREALRGLSSFAGNYRPAGVQIEKSNHIPPDAHLVPELIEQMCDYINDNWLLKTPIYLAAYSMWRLNWIHPFSDGNGRTSRILSYIILSIRAKNILPGTPTIPDQIVDKRPFYYEALDAADKNWIENQVIDVTKMENLLEAMLAKQLANFLKHATGTRTD